MTQKKMNYEYPPVRFPRQLRADLQEYANDIARSRGKERMSIADFVAEMFVEFKAKDLEPEEEG